MMHTRRPEVQRLPGASCMSLRTARCPAAPPCWWGNGGGRARSKGLSRQRDPCARRRLPLWPARLGEFLESFL
eukprot:gene17333-biopygen12869